MNIFTKDIPILMKHIFTILILGFLTVFSVVAQPGTNDLSFNVLDNVCVPEGLENGGSVVVVQPDDKILVGGYFTAVNGVSINRLARLNSDGTVDLTFNPGTGFNNWVNQIAIQFDGKIIVAGSFTNFNGSTVGRIIRLDANGAADLSFNVGTGFNSDVNSVVIQSDGKILVTGNFTTFNGTPANKIIRLNIDGSIDNSFDSGSGIDGSGSCIALQPDGKIIVSGTFTSYNGTLRKNIVRINSDGIVDNSFDPGSGFDDFVETIALQSDGKIIAAGGFTTFNGSPQNGVIRLNDDGTLDPSFATGTGINGWVLSSAIQADGKILLGGVFYYYNGIQKNSIVRLNIDGSIDASFNSGSGFNESVSYIDFQSDGHIIACGSFMSFDGLAANYIGFLNADGTYDTAMGPSGSGFTTTVRSLSVQLDGKILAGGDFSNFNNMPSGRLCRLLPDGTADPSFNIGDGFDDIVYATAVQADGKILVGGYYESFDGNAAGRIIRLHVDGSQDMAFDTGSGFDYIVRTIIVQPDGKIIIAGSLTEFNGSPIHNIIRLNEDGSVDPSFSTGTGFDGGVYASYLMPDGKIIFGGTFNTFNGTPSKGLVRLNSDGSLDNTFTTGTGFNGSIKAIAVQADGKIIAGGSYTAFNGTSRIRIARLNSNGTLDNTFNPGTGFNSEVSALSLQDDGKIIAGGSFVLYNGAAVSHLVRLNSNASLDVSFNPTVNDFVYVTAIQTDGNILVGGSFTELDGACRNRLARVLPNCNAANTTSTISVTACDSYTENSQTYTASGTYIQTISNTVGCDSIITINLNIQQSSSSVINHSACVSYTENGQTYTTSGTYMQTIPNSIGCDSVITINLTINAVDITTTVGSETVTANATGSYQWIDCDNADAPIIGQTAQTFTPPSLTGNYAVIVTEGVCSDTSDCITLLPVSLSKNDAYQILLFPNPTMDYFTLSDLPGSGTIEIKSLLGQRLLFETISNTEMKLDLSSFSNGMYIIQITSEFVNLTATVVKQ